MQNNNIEQRMVKIKESKNLCLILHFFIHYDHIFSGTKKSAGCLNESIPKVVVNIWTLIYYLICYWTDDLFMSF